MEALQEVKAELEGKTTLLYTRLLEDLTSQVSDAGEPEAGGGPARTELGDLTSLVSKAEDPEGSLHIRR